MAMGRPREFDVDKALDLALQVFWRKGYEGASMADLTETMGITKPSLYSAFGNKEELFRKALDRYVDGPGGYFQAALAKPTAHAVVEHLLYESADAVSDPNHPPGCLAVQGALSCGDAAESIKQELMSRRAKGEQDLRQRFERAIAEGDLPEGSDAADLAAYLSAILQGMAVQAAGGTTREQLRKIAEMALRTWPPLSLASV
ncbi:TetR/AcrR family transcriptional regulator [Bradyrhizobium sp. 200]|uniref:TetR/AcrR family transcriptional regulator n=1 Tax=Bradyrhizobium sp. 200 TaxID=2782665 RepID=UPI0020004D40|nr:TetR/AcrR family transcriptional regulator [Bradyrhizobium sp. 200]UPJ49542.1 TetR/AcrR family transcriptional regulator [Bradyrhizobium sp. 200]